MHFVLDKPQKFIVKIRIKPFWDEKNSNFLDFVKVNFSSTRVDP